MPDPAIVSLMQRLFTLALCLCAGLMATTATAAEHAQKILIVVTNHGKLGDTGEPTGYYLSEVAHPWHVFREAGYTVDFASPKGGFAPMDPRSFDLEDATNRTFWETLEAVQALAQTKKLGEIDPQNYAAIFFAGGHGTMWDFPSESVGKKLMAFYGKGKPVGAVCHGPAALLFARHDDGTLLIDGRKVGGFTNEEEKAVGLQQAVPFLLESKLKEGGADFHQGGKFEQHVSVSGHLVTGQNPASATAAAEEIVRLLQGQGHRS